MKQTEIGLIPDDWKVIKFGDKVDIFRGGSPRPIERYITTNAYGINWIKIGDVRPNDKYIRQTEEKIIPEGKSRSREVKKGDFILSNSMSFGRPYILNIDGCIHDGWLTIQNYSESFDKEFLYYLLGSDEVFKQYVQMAAGSSVQNLNKEKVADLQLKVPPLPEQQRIAKALSDVDALISTTEKLIQKKKNIKQGAMQELLTGKKRLPGFAKSTRTKMTELGEIPEDWEVKTLGEIGYFIGGGTPDTNKIEYWKGSIPWISSSDISKNNIKDIFQTRFITETAIKNSATKICPKNTILIVSRVGVGKLAISKKEVCTSQDFSNLVCMQQNVEFVAYQLLPIMQKKSNDAQGTSIKGITTEEIKNMKIALPPKEEQTAIANVLSSMDKEIETLNTKLEKYRNLKTAMMQQLLTGKIRLMK